MAMRIAYWGGASSTMAWLDRPPCGDSNCSGSSAGSAAISNIRVASDCTREIAIRGAGGASFVSGGDGGIAAGDRLTLSHNSGFSITTSCEDDWDPNGFKIFKLLGKTMSFTVDLSKVGCACNIG